jgi:hypothetical protein
MIGFGHLVVNGYTGKQDDTVSVSDSSSKEMSERIDKKRKEEGVSECRRRKVL